MPRGQSPKHGNCGRMALQGKGAGPSGRQHLAGSWVWRNRLASWGVGSLQGENLHADSEVPLGFSAGHM